VQSAARNVLRKFFWDVSEIASIDRMPGCLTSHQRIKNQHAIVVPTIVVPCKLHH